MDANAGVFEAVLTDQDVIIADRLVHASLVDGIRLCKALQESYKHNDMKHSSASSKSSRTSACG